MLKPSNSRIRSAIYVPGDHAGAIAKAPSLAADCILFDLEDGVAPEQKGAALSAICDSVSKADYGRKTLVVRINHKDTPYYAADLLAIAQLPVHGIMLSKVASVADVNDALRELAQHERADLGIWCNVETPLGVVNARAIAAHDNVVALVAGTNDLANDLRIIRTPDRAGLMHCLQEIQLAARAYGCVALDGTFVNLDDADGLKREAEQGRMLGFDGKTLIHPKQIDVANEVFGISAAELAEAQAIITAYEAAMAEQKAVTLLNGRMIERLHYDRARELVGIRH